MAKILRQRCGVRGVALASLAVLANYGGVTSARNQAGSSTIQKEKGMTKHASGAFDVKATPQKPDNAVSESANLGRMALDKQFHGALEATSKGEMLSAMTEKGSGGYVAMERVTGTLDGRSGSFLLQHSGTMTRGEPSMLISVVPDSGTGQLAGLAGTMVIEFPEGKHFYKFSYELPEGH